MPPLARYTLNESSFEITVVKAVIGILIITFSLLELWPRFQALAFPSRWLPLGGMLSGFFGGLSGNQGGAAFGLSNHLRGDRCGFRDHRRCLALDRVRHRYRGRLSGPIPAIDRTGCGGGLCAFIGSFAGRQVLRKVTCGPCKLSLR